MRATYIGVRRGALGDKGSKCPPPGFFEQFANLCSNFVSQYKHFVNIYYYWYVQALNILHVRELNLNLLVGHRTKIQQSKKMYN